MVWRGWRPESGYLADVYSHKHSQAKLLLGPLPAKGRSRKDPPIMGDTGRCMSCKVSLFLSNNAFASALHSKLMDP